MKKFFILITLITVFTSVSAQERKDSISTQLSNLDALMPYWLEYVQKCTNDSTLQVWWEYTGKEKPTQSIDTTIVMGVETKVITYTPTIKTKWIKEDPTITGLRKYMELKIKKDESDK